VIVHGDFYVRHLLINGRRQVTGIIDWGDLHIGDPAVDFIIAHSFLPPQVQEAFKKAYGPIDHNSWELARLRAAYHSTNLAVYGQLSQDPMILKEGLLGLEFISRAWSS
jgi:aminoglycoside phosphotransferase (APT) family kinase protein